MYSQEIVISPDIFNKISKAFTPGFDEDLDLKSYKENLKLKLVLFDKNENDESILEDKIKEIMNSSSDFGKRKIDVILKSLLTSGKIDYKTIPRMNVYCNNQIINRILNLSLFSESKIINSEDNSALLYKMKHEELKDIEILNFEEFIEPPDLSRLFSRKRKIKIDQGQEFKFENILKPYLIDSENLIINDRYLRNKNRGFAILKKLLILCRNLKSVTIHTILRDSNPIDNFDMTLTEFRTSFQKEFPNVNIEIKETNKILGKDRFIQTEYSRLEFSPGIDFVNDRYIADKNPIKIEIEYIDRTMTEII